MFMCVPDAGHQEPRAATRSDGPVRGPVRYEAHASKCTHGRMFKLRGCAGLIVQLPWIEGFGVTEQTACAKGPAE